MKKAVTNTKEHTIYVGGQGIPPGDTRMVDASFVDAPAQVDDDPEPDPVRELLELNVSELEAALANQDSDHELDLLEAALETEQLKSSPRKGAIKALEAAIATATEAALEAAAGSED